MSKTVKRVLLVAALFYLGAFATCLTGNELHPVDPHFEHVSSDWTIWDYANCIFLLLAVGSTIAAVWLQGEDDEDE